MELAFIDFYRFLEIYIDLCDFGSPGSPGSFKNLWDPGYAFLKNAKTRVVL